MEKKYAKTVAASSSSSRGEPNQEHPLPMATGRHRRLFVHARGVYAMTLFLALGVTACDQNGGGKKSSGGGSSAPDVKTPSGAAGDDAGVKSRGNVIHSQELEAKGAIYDVWVSHDKGLLIAGAQKQGSKRRSIHTFATTDASLAGQLGMPIVTDTSKGSIKLVPPSSAQITVGEAMTAIQLK
ncbi:hypothetical protein [Lignipirellula cremea]|uniref:Uncharacterized protein n=1 Tax=Lignipirellula cremea TaxID=2528010 RepID=A0A518DUR2_9BACT|nr:hypothetical protein [Lignipirellula cremea]QDU95580.1 hypothetical protein Pla8534_33960 [Lignipirellula cremea]